MAIVAPNFSLICFVDDSLLFFKAHIDYFLTIEDVFSWYEQALAQLVNFYKSEVCFGSQVPSEVFDVFVNIQWVKNGGIP